MCERERERERERKREIEREREGEGEKERERERKRERKSQSAVNCAANTANRTLRRSDLLKSFHTHTHTHTHTHSHTSLQGFTFRQSHPSLWNCSSGLCVITR